MDTSVKKIVLSVIITTILVLISVPLWNYSSGRKGAILASSYEDLSISVEIGRFDSLNIIEDERAFDNITPTEISLRNRNDVEKEFELLFLIDKKSTIPYEYIKVSINNTIYNVKDLNMIEDNDNYYFILEELELDAYSQDVKLARIWLSEEMDNVDDEAILSTNFITR